METSDVKANPTEESVETILLSLRVPDLPYPATSVETEKAGDWCGLLHQSWVKQLDERVIEVLDDSGQTWTRHQVNAGYLADRTMDLFLGQSGLHPTLLKRLARLRFYFAWQIERSGHEALARGHALRDWLDFLLDLRGWSDCGGRASRQLLSDLDELKTCVSAAFDAGDDSALRHFVLNWRESLEKKHKRVSKLRKRLFETERGAARQRAADQTARAFLGRTLGERPLPPALFGFIVQHWVPVIRDAIWNEGLESEAVRHAVRLLEWLVWVGDSSLSNREPQKLYQVGEKLPEHLSDVWNRVRQEAIPRDVLAPIEQVMVSRVRAQDVQVEPVSLPAFDIRWLELERPDASMLAGVEGHWFVEGEGQDEQRFFVFAFLEDSAELLLTNGEGVKKGIMEWERFHKDLQTGRFRPLPDITPFAEIVNQSVALLHKVAVEQKAKREEARLKARQKAEALRRQKARLEQENKEREAARRREEEEQRRQQEQLEREAEQVRAMEREQALRADIRERLNQLQMGHWISAIIDGEDRQMKLAVRLHGSQKFVFVDRLGLNRTEYLDHELEDAIYQGKARLLSQEAEFEETLSRVVGRIRVGRS